ncbi:MmcQ/YjbR family DNA-binding protein [Marinilongibacter aquaticus]|uniref:MmcQ/YjbR family DNA-binding protein n=1 Tax=Marinilongibacter aquaticus TaxID=2975157 RepID=UPI0021BDABD3|nr:MmcQ/YjbR family DNA-binding protein [Marinilongibacter aquaticus]UBM58577.1 MmcQ/YjbR family DNA-binding protein [Marinilongibacter aquaticus]
MISEENFIEMALSFPGTEQKPHFDRVGFKLIGKRMFASYLAKNNTSNIFLSLDEQKAFCELSPTYIFPVPNKWGEKGATTFELNHLPKEYVYEALLSAYSAVLNSKKSK